MSNCPAVISGDAAVALTGEGWSTFRGFAESSYQLVVSQFNALNNFTVQDFAFSPDYSFAGNLSGFLPPEAPAYITAPAGDFSMNVGDVSLAFSPPALVEAPEFDFNGEMPTLDIGGEPGAFEGELPDGPPEVEEVEFPTAPTLTMPELPTLVEITLPTVPTLDLPTFTATAPVVDFDAPAQNFSFTPTEFSDELLDDVRTALADMFEGEALPPAVEQALRERAYAEVDRNEMVAVQQATEDWASRGFTEPDGVLVGRVLEIRQNSQNQRNNLSREVYIENRRTAIESRRFAVTQGIALTQVLINLHMQTQQLLLEANKFALQASIELFNARVTLFNALVGAYNTAAIVYRARLEAALATVELYKAQIEAERVKGEINEQYVRLYEQRIRALLTEVEVFKAQVDAARSRVEANNAQFEGYRIKVQAFAESVRAHGLAWDGYVARVNAQVARGRLYEIATTAFGTQVAAVNSQNQVAIGASQARTAIELAKVEKFRAHTQAEIARIGALSAESQALVQVGQANASLYAARGQVAAAASDAVGRQFQIGMENERARVDSYLKASDIQMQKMVQTAGLLLESIKAAANVAAQLAASSMSAVNFGATVSSSQSSSESTGCSTSYNYQGEIA